MILSLITRLQTLPMALRSERGAGMSEYALLLVLVGVVVALTLPTLTGAISGAFTAVSTQITNNTP